MITAENVLSNIKFIAEELGKSVPSILDIETELKNKDFDKIVINWQSRIVMSEWDKISNINQATAKVILENNPWADVIYMLLIDGKLVYLQTHMPFVQGYQPITSENVKEVSDNHIFEISKDLAFNQIVSEIWLALGN